MALFEEKSMSALDLLKDRGPKTTKRFDDKDLDLYQRGTP